jgi:EmrB/QacA subfamily drug resistance transporter
MSVGHPSCDAASAWCRDEGTKTPPHPWLVITTTILASSLAFIDGSVVNVALPAIGASLHGEAAGLQWVVNAFLLPLSALLLFGGAAGDRFGKRRLLIGGVALFGVASVACAAAPSLGWLLAARFVQGTGAALLMPNSLAILGVSFSGEAKGRAVGIWAAAGAVGGAIGPVLGGWLTDVWSWRAIFLINIPLVAAAMLFAYRYVSPDDEKPSSPLDVLGSILATVTLGVTTWALTEGSARGWSILAVAGTVGGLLLLAGFVFVERRKGDEAMMPVVMFGSPAFAGLSILTFLVYGALGGLFVLVPYLLIEARSYSAAEAGAALLPLPVILAVLSPGAGALAAKIGSRLPLIVGPLIVAAGFAFALLMGTGQSYWLSVLPGMTVIALGMALAVAPLTAAVLSSVDARHVGTASGLNSAIARTGSLVATALVGAVMSATGPALVGAFGIAALVGAALCVGASVAAYFLISR